MLFCYFKILARNPGKFYAREHFLVRFTLIFTGSNLFVFDGPCPHFGLHEFLFNSWLTFHSASRTLAAVLFHIFAGSFGLWNFQCLLTFLCTGIVSIRRTFKFSAGRKESSVDLEEHRIVVCAGNRQSQLVEPIRFSESY